MGRIKEISRKSAHTRKRNPVVYLICEGSETEIRYFKRFRSRGCNIDIIPISSQSMRVLKERCLKKREAHRHRHDAEQRVWAVSNKSLAEAKGLCIYEDIACYNGVWF